MRLIWIILFGILLATMGPGAASADEIASSGDAVNLLAAAPAPMVEQVLDLPDPEVDQTAFEADISNLITLAFENNPGLESARANWQAIVEVYPQATSLPDPELEVMRGGTGDYSLQLMQMIPNPRKVRLLGDLALTQAEIGRIAYEKKVRDVISDVLSSYFELGYLHRASDIASTNRDLFKQLVDLANLRYAQGEIGTSELSATESRLSQAEYEYLLLQELIFSEESNMRTLLGADPGFEIGIVILPDFDLAEIDLEEIREKAQEYRLELEMAGISVDMAELGVSLARSEGDPNFSLGLNYESMGTSSTSMTDEIETGTSNSLSLMFGITIPIWSGKNKGQIHQAEALLRAAEADFENQTNIADSDVEQLYWRLQNQGRLVELYRNNLLPQAISATDFGQTWYEADQISFTGLIETRMVVQNFELATARAEADYLKSLVDLQKITGIQMFENDSQGVDQ